MAELYNEVLKIGKDRWYTKTGLAVVAITFATILVVTFAGLDLANVSLFEWVVVLLVVAVVIVFWWRTHIPRIAKGKVGVAVAIVLEDTKEANQLRADFIENLRELLAGSQFNHKFEFRELPSRMAGHVALMEDHSQFLRRSNIHYLLYGRARQRELNGEMVHVIDLKGVVRHGQVSPDIRTRFSQDFGEALPNRLIVNMNAAMLEFEMAAKNLDATARYIIGTAAALSNDFSYSEELLLDAEKRISAFVQNEEGAPSSSLLGKVRLRIADLYQAWSLGLSQQYFQSRDKDILVKQERIAASLLKYSPGNIDAHLASATCAFMLHRNLDLAFSETLECRMVDDGIWKYSIAFLHAYKGELQEAYDWYRRAFSSPLQNYTVPNQCEEFIQLILEEEPDKYQLYYALGLINHRAKRDYDAAVSDFNTFMGLADEKKYGVQVSAAKKWVREMTRL